MNEEQVLVQNYKDIWELQEWRGDHWQGLAIVKGHIPEKYKHLRVVLCDRLAEKKARDEQEANQLKMF